MHPLTCSRLIGLSIGLDLDDDQLTPAQAYAAVRDSVPGPAFVRPVLDALKGTLGGMVECRHFGSVVEAGGFWRCFEGAVEGLRFTRPELGG